MWMIFRFNKGKITMSNTTKEDKVREKARVNIKEAIGLLSSLTKSNQYTSQYKRDLAEAIEKLADIQDLIG